MDLVGKRVIHKTLGEGVITESEKDYVKIKFPKEKNLKKFAYPVAFEKFLTFVDEESKREAETDLDQYNRKIEAQEEQKRKEKAEELKQYARYELKCKEAKYREHIKKRDIEINRFHNITDFFMSYRSYVTSEAAVMMATRGMKYNLFNGTLVPESGSQYVYIFDTEEELNIPSGIDIIFNYQGVENRGVILWCENYLVAISVSINMGDKVAELKIGTESWKLLYKLNDRLETLMENPTPIVRDLTCHGFDNIDYSNRKITSGQDKAIEMSLSQPITFIWGPPGTGKTYTLSKIVLEHIKSGNRVLMMSYSNVSVDGAILKVYERDKNLKPGIAVRYGYPKSEEVLNHEYLTSYSLALRNNPGLVKEKDEIKRKLRSLNSKSKEYNELQKRLVEIKETLSEKEKEIVYKAGFVATTVSKAVMDKTLYESKFDVVIFDEASMALIPQVIFAAGLAKKHFVCIGDFRQLPPIVQNDRLNQLKCDIFKYCGIDEAVNSGRNHKWLCMLDKQYRMHPDIADFASISMYMGHLQSHDELENSRLNIIKDEPFPGSAISLVDLSGMMSVCLKTKAGSKFNILSALVTFYMALVAAEEHEIGIIAPYNAQAKLLRAMCRDIESSHNNYKQITCSTVHQFQGSEKDIVFYDAVDCYISPYISGMLTKAENNYANRLFNVAMTRAKGKFVSVANVDYMMNKKLAGTLMFRRLIDQLRDSTFSIKGREITEYIKKYDVSNMQVYKVAGDAYEQFEEDLLNAKKEVRIDIPDLPKRNKFLDSTFPEILEKVLDNGVPFMLRTGGLYSLPNKFSHYERYLDFILNPVAVIDEKVMWFGMPLSDAEFKAADEVAPISTRPVIRFEGSHTAKTVKSFLDMDERLSVIKPQLPYAERLKLRKVKNLRDYIEVNVKCEKCGEPMTLSRNENGVFTLYCTSEQCNCTKRVDETMLHRYLKEYKPDGAKCKICGKPLIIKDGYRGCYFECTGKGRHKNGINDI